MRSAKSWSSAAASRDCGRCGRLRARAGRDHADRSQQSPPVPATALPGGHRRTGRAVDRRAAALHPARAAQCHGAHGRSHRASTRPTRRVQLRRSRASTTTICWSPAAHVTPISGTTTGSAIAPGLKTLDDAFVIRRRILDAFERAEATSSDAERDACLTFAVIGGGPTGVELAGTLAEIARHTLAQRISPHRFAPARVLLIEAGPRVLSTFVETLSGEGARAARAARRRGAHRHAGHRHRRRLPGRSAVNASRRAPFSGPRASRPHHSASSSGAELDRAGRVHVARRSAVPGHPEIFVAGDLASLQQDGKPVPGVAPAAKQMGALRGAQHRSRCSRAARPRPFRYRDWGSLATIGRHSAVAQLPTVAALRNLRLVVLAAAAHLLPDRIPQPAHRAHQLGLGLFHLRARRAHHPRHRSERNLHGSEERKQRLRRPRANRHRSSRRTRSSADWPPPKLRSAIDHAGYRSRRRAGAPGGRRAARRVSRAARRTTAAAGLAALQRRAAHAVSARSVAHACQATRRCHRGHGGIPRSAHRGARRRRPLLDAQRPASPGGRQGARTQADHRADLARRIAVVSHPRAEYREGAQPQGQVARGGAHGAQSRQARADAHRGVAGGRVRSGRAAHARAGLRRRTCASVAAPTARCSRKSTG